MPSKPKVTEEAASKSPEKSAPAVKKNESRVRRSYSCGPCKKYKTRCNLETPCQSCVSARRPEECLRNPPDPPSEAEKSRIEKRRIKSTSKKGEGAKNVSRRNSTDRAKGKTDPDQDTSLASAVDLYTNMAPDIIVVPKIRVTHLKDFTFIRASYQEWNRQTIVIPLEQFVRCKNLARFLTYETLLKYFSLFSNWDSDGFQYLVDAQGCFNVATNFILKVPDSPEDLDSRTYNVLSVRALCNVFMIISLGKVLDGDSIGAEACLAFAYELTMLLGPPASLGDFIHHGIYVLLNKMPSLLLGNPLRLVTLFKNFTLMMSGSKEVLRYIKMTDPVEREGNEEFIAFARVWVLARFAEPEISVLGAQGSLQLSIPETSESISPNPGLSKELFNSKLDVLAPDCYLFDIVLSQSSMYFPRFSGISDVRELIYNYLMSYSDLGTTIAPLTARMYLEIQKDSTTIAGAIKYNDAILVSILVNYINTRWLRLIKVERPYFPTLRFAHFVSSLMSTFNWIEELDYRLFDGDGSIYSLVLCRSKNFLFLQMYLQLTHQAIFLVVFAQFRSPSSHLLTIDLDYIFRCVYASMSTVLQKVRMLEPFCSIPAIANVLAVVESLEEFALSTPILADDPEELIEALQTYIDPIVWDAMALMSYGSQSACAFYIEQLWSLAMGVQSNGTGELFITKHLKLDTDFLRNYETSFEPFRFTQEMAEQYIKDVVEPEMGLHDE